MSLSKKRNKERMRLIRGSVQPTCNLSAVKPVQPNETSRLVQPKQIPELRMPGEVILRPYSKESQLHITLDRPTKLRLTVDKLKHQFDYRRG